MKIESSLNPACLVEMLRMHPEMCHHRKMMKAHWNMTRHHRTLIEELLRKYDVAG
jgi:hypothetical protein